MGELETMNQHEQTGQGRPESAPRLPSPPSLQKQHQQPPRQLSEEKPAFRKAAGLADNRISIELIGKPMLEDAAATVRASPTEVTKTDNDVIKNDNKNEPILQNKNKLAAHAWNQRLQEQLFHRTQEERSVLQCYESMLQGKDCPLLLITGPRGSGKSRLVKQTLKRRVCDQGGYFITGKFDVLQRPEPFRAFASAFADFSKQVIERGPQAVAEMRETIERTVDDVCVLTSVISDLAPIVCEPSVASCKTKSSDAIQQFVFAFRMFMRAISSIQRPVVLLLDDLHFADRCSLDLLTYQVGDLKDNPGLFIVGTCDDSDQSIMTKESYLAIKLREMDKICATPIVHIPLRNLDPGEVNHLLGNSLHLASLELSEDLGSIVTSQTQGNIFYIIEFLRWMQDSGLLTYDETEDSWRWDAEEIRMTINLCNVGDFLTDKLELLPMELRDVLKVAACFGYEIEEELIELVLGFPVEELLAQAVDHGILVFDSTYGKYAFEHDSLQSAAYNLIPASDRELFHLEVGRRLWRGLSKEKLDQHVFLVLSQIKIGKRLITREKERYAIANLCLHAGTKAAKSTSFRTASVYLNLAINILDERSWHIDYDLTLAIYNAAAEMELCTANYEGMEELTLSVLKHARTPLDKIQANATRIYGLGLADRPQEALDIGIRVLEGVGERFPRRLCRHRLMGEMRKVRCLLQGKSDSQIMRLPNMEDPQKLACLQILNNMFLHSLMARPRLSYFISLKMLRMTLIDGLSMIAPVAFATYGMLCISATGDIDAGWWFGELAIQLLEQLGARAYLPRVYAAFYGCIFPWKRPLRDALGPLNHAHHVGMKLGDAEFGGLCANLHNFSSLDCGVPLHHIEAEWSALQELLVTQRQLGPMRVSFPCMQAIHHYMGRTEDPLSAKGDLIDFDEMLKFAVDNELTNYVLGIRISRMLLAYIFNDYELASSFAEIAVKEMWSMPPTVDSASSSFFAALVNLAMAREGKQVGRNIRRAKKTLKRLKGLARRCPSNFLDKKFLLEAELASVCGNDCKAVENFVCAISLSREMKFLHIQALANERMARHYIARNNVAEAIPFFLEAITLYTEWNGYAKVERLRSEVEILRANHESVDL